MLPYFMLTTGFLCFINGIAYSLTREDKAYNTGVRTPPSPPQAHHSAAPIAIELKVLARTGSIKRVEVLGEVRNEPRKKLVDVLLMGTNWDRLVSLRS